MIKMLVKELKEKLNQFDDDCLVYRWDEEIKFEFVDKLETKYLAFMMWKDGKPIWATLLDTLEEAEAHPVKFGWNNYRIKQVLFIE